MKKILHIGLSSNFGGVESYVQNICSNVRQSDFSFSFLATSKLANQELLINLGGEIIQVTPREDSYFRHLLELIQLFRNKRTYDVIEVHLMSYSWFEPIVLAKLFSPKSKLILHSHATSEASLSLKTKILSKVGRFLVRPSNTRYILTACGVDAGIAFFGRQPFKVLANGIELNRFAYKSSLRKVSRKLVDAKADSTVLMHVGRFSVQKNHLKLLEIFNAYLKINPKAIMVLVGDGEMRSTIEAKVADLGIHGNVRLMGSRNDMDLLYNAADIILMPSLYEGLPVSLIEAQSNGLKCVVSDTVSQEANITGNLVYIKLANSSEFWAQKISSEQFVRSEKVIEKLKNTEYDISNTVHNVAKIYNQVNKKGNKA